MRDAATSSLRTLADSVGVAVETGRADQEPRVTELAAASERDLILRTRAGEKAAFGELVRRHMRRAYFSALGLIGSHEDALDLSQEAFVRAFRSRAKLDPERPFFAWLYQIVRRLCFNHTRDRGTRRRKLDEAEGWLVSQAQDRAVGQDPQGEIERREQTERLAEAIEGLGDRDREVLVLKEFEGLRYREIAELLEIPIGTVMSRLYSARRRLADAMGEPR